MHSLLDRYKSRPKDKAVRLGSHVYRRECMTFCRNSNKVELIATALNVPGGAQLICVMGKEGACLLEMSIQQQEGATASFHNREQKT